ncbi:MAG: hypothetical protein WCD79_07495 [Chthoniobacteraceae bacterium]
MSHHGLLKEYEFADVKMPMSDISDVDRRSDEPQKPISYFGEFFGWLLLFGAGWDAAYIATENVEMAGLNPTFLRLLPFIGLIMAVFILTGLQRPGVANGVLFGFIALPFLLTLLLVARIDLPREPSLASIQIANDRFGMESHGAYMHDNVASIYVPRWKNTGKIRRFLIDNGLGTNTK